ncbi:hypothetical protein ES705_35290 [subsurface metagenome]
MWAMHKLYEGFTIELCTHSEKYLFSHEGTPEGMPTAKNTAKGMPMAKVSRRINH